MTQREAEAVIEMLDTCREPVEVKAERAEGTAATDTSERAATEWSSPYHTTNWTKPNLFW